MCSTNFQIQKKHFSHLPLILSLLLFTTLGACNKEESAEYRPQLSTQANTNADVKTYIFSIHPLHNPTRLHEIFAPLMDYLSRNIEGAKFQLQASRNYSAYNQKLYSGAAHFSLPNPYQTVNAIKHGYRVFAKMGDDDNFRGIILVRKDSDIKEVSDLKGKTVSYPAPTALAATIMPQYYLHTHGLNAMQDIETRYVGSQESSIMNVFLGNVAAGATWPPPWQALVKERPELAEQIEIKWQTSPLPNNALIAHQTVPDDLVQQVARLVIELHTHPEGRQILARMELSRFEPATNSTYDPVIRFLETFSNTVRPLK